MKYKFNISYTPTVGGLSVQRECHPVYNDDLSVTLEMESDEWYRRRKLDGKLTFVRDDYAWIMACSFDGTFRLTVESSTDGGASWQSYIEGTFSRADLEVDEDNRNVVLSGLNESGEYDVIENGKKEDYDLMKIIPDSETKTVQGQVKPALALVDYRANNISKSDVFCGGASTASGYKADEKTGWTNVALSGGGNNKWAATGALQRVPTDSKFSIIGVYAEAKVEMKEGYTDLDGFYCGNLQYTEIPAQYDVVSSYTTVAGTLRKSGSTDRLEIIFPGGFSGTMELTCQPIHNNASQGFWTLFQANGSVFSPSSIELTENAQYNQHFKKVTFYFHYIRATLLTQDGGNADNVLDTGDYYKRMAAFNNGDGGLRIAITANTVEQPNGHRLVPGTGERGTVPQYFAPPDETEHWIPLAEDNWNYASMWYTIVPSVANGLLDPARVGRFRWANCWTLGTCIDRLLRKISGGKVTFEQSVAGSEFLYAAVNPVTQGEQFEYLFTQKSNVMHPSAGGESAARCPVRLDWFLEFLRNGLNCYWWLEERSGGMYAFRVEHVEWFRRGGSYVGQLDGRIDLTQIKTRRNFVRNGEAAKRLDDQLHKYSYDMQGMTEKYTFAWQGDGGSDAFKGNPMFFKAGWIERGSSEKHEVDNIFADLSWLMLNAGTETESSKNYDGIFVFAGYVPAENAENSSPSEQVLELGALGVFVISLTAPQGAIITVGYQDSPSGLYHIYGTYTGTGAEQAIYVNIPVSRTTVVSIDFGVDYANTIIHRIHLLSGPVYNVPNAADRLNPGNYLQNGPLAWPWLQCAYLHYDIPAKRWGYDSDDIDTVTWEDSGTVKMCKVQDVPLLPLPMKADEDMLDSGVKGGLRDSQGQLQTGIVKSAEINIGTRNATLTLMYDMIS